MRKELKNLMNSAFRLKTSFDTNEPDKIKILELTRLSKRLIEFTDAYNDNTIKKKETDE